MMQVAASFSSVKPYGAARPGVLVTQTGWPSGMSMPAKVDADDRTELLPFSE